MTKTATFSNGFTDTYKGKRDVRAAWMVVTPDNRIVSGHSQDVPTAHKTALNSAGAASGCMLHMPRGGMSAASAHYWEVEARRQGFKSTKALKAHWDTKRADFIASCKIEVVAL